MSARRFKERQKPLFFCAVFQKKPSLEMHIKNKRGDCMKFLEIDPIVEGYAESKMYPGVYANRYGDILARYSKNGKIYRPALCVNSYGYVVFRYRGKTVKVHRVVADIYCDHPAGCDQVNHKNGNKQKNNYENLEWCTCRYNMLHAYNNGLSYDIGKLTTRIPDECVNDIRNSCLPTSVLAMMYGCTARNIRYIRNWQTRKSVR